MSNPARSLKIKCDRPTCKGPRYSIGIDGICTMCQRYTRGCPSDGKKTCCPENCTGTQKLLEDGTCKDCAPKQKAGQQLVDGKERPIVCISIQCEANQKIVGTTCIDCQPYTRPNALANQCIADTCDSEREILNREGYCKPCPDFTRSRTGGKVCAADICYSRSVLQRDGTCKKCLDYTFANQVKKKCEIIDCGET